MNLDFFHTSKRVMFSAFDIVMLLKVAGCYIIISVQLAKVTCVQEQNFVTFCNFVMF